MEEEIFGLYTFREQDDIILARSDYKLEKMVTSNDSGIAANIVSWSNGEDIQTTIITDMQFIIHVRVVCYRVQ